jgi:hypothetical protein
MELQIPILVAMRQKMLPMAKPFTVIMMEQVAALQPEEQLLVGLLLEALQRVGATILNGVARAVVQTRVIIQYIQANVAVRVIPFIMSLPGSVTKPAKMRTTQTVVGKFTDIMMVLAQQRVAQLLAELQPVALPPEELQQITHCFIPQIAIVEPLLLK